MPYRAGNPDTVSLRIHESTREQLREDKREDDTWDDVLLRHHEQADGGDGQQLPQDILDESARVFQEHDLGGMTLQGRLGFHTHYAWDSDDPTTPFETALHMALAELFESIHVDPDTVEYDHGTVTPETIAETTVEQIHDLTGVRFDTWSREQFEELLAERLEYLNEPPAAAADGGGA